MMTYLESWRRQPHWHAEGDHIEDLESMKKGCQLRLLGTELERQRALCFAEALVKLIQLKRPLACR